MRPALLFSAGMITLGLVHPLRAGSPEAPVRESRLVIVGTVKQLRASTIPGVPVSDSTIVVQIDQVLRAPSLLGDLKGRDVTVVTRRKAPPVGRQALFYANVWRVGRGLAVVEVDRIEGVDAREFSRGFAAAVSKEKDHALRARLDGALLVVVGEVSRILPAEYRGNRSRSEHDPKWRKAVVRVESIEKGQLSADSVHVVFPGSSDVMWSSIRRFKDKDTGIWLLHTQRISTRGDSAWAAHDSLDFLPKTELEHVRKLMRGK